MSSQRVITSAGQRDGKILILNGFPGTGKLTILSHLKSSSPDDTIRLIDNHLLIDPAQAVYPDRGPAHHELRQKIREPVFKAIRALAQEGKTIFMTVCLAKNDADTAVYREHLRMIGGTGIRLFWVNLRCEQSILEQRLASTERQRGQRTKLTDVGILRKLMSKNQLLGPRLDDPGHILYAGTLDVSGTVEEAADLLLRELGNRGWNRGWEAPIRRVV